MSETRDIKVNNAAVAALVTGALLLAPVALILALIAIYQIRTRGESGLVLALMALVISIFVPVAAYSFVYGRTPGLDACVHVQDKAVGALRMIAHLEEQFHEKEGRYGSLKEISWGPKIDLKPYSYKIAYAKDDTFLAVAEGFGPVDGDEMVIDQTRVVRRIRDVCRARHESP